MGQSTEPHVGPDLVVIAGPTASGKSSLALELAARMNAEIVSADSMQVYRGLDIGTAKPTLEEQAQVPHHLIDVVQPDEPYDAARFLADADRAISGIAERGHRPLIVGGTGLYIRALLHGLHQGPSPDEALRQEIVARGEAVGWPALHRELNELDPVTAERLHPTDRPRILRALEVVRLSGVPLSEWQQQHGFHRWRYRALVLGVERPREVLYDRINRRVDQMIEEGFLAEVSRLLDRGHSPALKPMQGLGYRRLCQHLQGACTLDEAVEQTKTDTRRFAKRQLTWFNREEGLQWLAPKIDRAMALIGDFLA